MDPLVRIEIKNMFLTTYGSHGPLNAKVAFERSLIAGCMREVIRDLVEMLLQ